MRRENRKKEFAGKSSTNKTILYTGIGVAILAVIVFALFMYSKSLSEDVKNDAVNLEKMANMVNNTQNTENAQNTQSTSMQIGRSIEESKNELNTNNSTTNQTSNTSNTTNASNATNTTSTSNSKSNTTKNTITQTTKTNESTNNTSITTNSQAQVKGKKELSFERPVEGEIIREYAKDNLIYSNTLEEWTTHMGIDIKADKTTVVKAAEGGTIKSIKNDPRYGLTIVIEHDNNFQTIYSNLLTSEFVVEGEKVEKGQSIGTVGNTAVFEIVDESHLHFEIWKDNLPEDPSIYIK